MDSKIGEMVRTVTELGDGTQKISFDGRTCLPKLSFFDAFRDHQQQADIYRRFIVQNRSGKEIGWLQSIGPDQNGHALYNIRVSIDGGPSLFIAGIEIQPNLFALHLREEEQACIGHLEEASTGAA